MVEERAASRDTAPIAAVLRDVAWTAEDRRRAGLNELRLVLYEGERVALVGTAPSGRHALLRLLDGQLRGWAGTVIVLGQPLRPDRAAMRRRRRLTAFIPRDPALIGRLSVEQNVMTGRLGHRPVLGSLLGRVAERDRRAVAKAMQEAGVDGLARRRAEDLSEEERRNVALARGLAQQPRMLLADAVTGLAGDPQSEHRHVRRLCEIARERRATLVFGCCHGDLALRHADRVVLMRNGHAALSDAPEALDPAQRARLLRASGGAAGATGLRRVV